MLSRNEIIVAILVAVLVLVLVILSRNARGHDVVSIDGVTVTYSDGTTKTITPPVIGPLPSTEPAPPPPVPVDSGFTPIRIAADARQIWCDAQGSDANPGTKARPVKSIRAGYALLRAGFPDVLWLSGGDEWKNESLAITKSGRSKEWPQVIASPPDVGARARLASKVTAVSIGTVKNVMVVGLEIINYEKAPRSGQLPINPRNTYHYGIRAHGDFENVTIEDCDIAYWSTGAAFIPPNRAANIRVRRSIFRNCYDLPSWKGISLYANRAENPLLEENVFYQDGFLPGVGGESFLSQAVYLQAKNGLGFPARASGNAFIDNASCGIQMREGGTCEDNLFVDNGIHGFAGGTGANVIANNVLIGGRDISPQHKRGWGWELLGKKNTFVGNLIVNKTSPSVGKGWATTLNETMDECLYKGNVISGWNGTYFDVQKLCKVLTFEDNTFANPVNPNGYMVRLRVSPMKFVNRNNTIHPALPQFTNPNVSLPLYSLSVGGIGTKEHLWLKMTTRARGEWDSKYSPRTINAYMRKGFGL